MRLFRSVITVSRRGNAGLETLLSVNSAFFGPEEETLPPKVFSFEEENSIYTAMRVARKNKHSVNDWPQVAFKQKNAGEVKKVVRVTSEGLNPVKA